MAAIPASAPPLGPPVLTLSQAQGTPVTNLVNNSVTINYNIVLCNTGGAVTNGPVTVTDNYVTNNSTCNAFQFGCWGYGDAFQPYTFCFYGPTEGQANEPTSNGSSLVFPSLGSGCVTMTAQAIDYYDTVANCGLTLVAQAAVTWNSGSAASNSVTYVQVLSTATCTPTGTSTQTTPLNTATGTPTSTCTPTPTNSPTSSPTNTVSVTPTASPTVSSNPPAFSIFKTGTSPVTNVANNSVTIDYNIVLCNNGGPVNGAVTVTDDFLTNTSTCNNFQFGCWGYGDSLQPYTLCYYSGTPGLEPTAVNNSMVFPNFGTGCVTMTARVVNYYDTVGNCGLTLVDQAAVSWDGGNLPSNSVTYIQQIAAPTPAVTATATVESTVPLLYPNPSNGVNPVTLYLPGVSGTATVDILTVSGRRVRSMPFTVTPEAPYVSFALRAVDRTPLSNGLYFLLINTPKGRTVLKILVLR